MKNDKSDQILIEEIKKVAKIAYRRHVKELNIKIGNIPFSNIDRIIVLIREQGRKWDKECEGSMFLKKGGLVKSLKLHFMNDPNTPSKAKDRLKYL